MDRMANNGTRYRPPETSAPTRYTGINITLYGRGEAVAMNYAASTSTKGGAAYLGKDILGSIRSVSNSQAGLEDRYEYDAFGKPYKGDLENGMSLGYTGKPYDAATGMYNYGYRDYKPENARFTTIDPVRDGANWFAYVNNDPVNYRDLWGLECNTPANDKDAKPEIYSNSSTFTTLVPIDSFATGGVAIGLFSATVTTTVSVTPGSNTVDVYSYTTRGPELSYNATATTTATVTANGNVYNTGTLTPQPSIHSPEHSSLGGTTLNIPSSGTIAVTTTTTWAITNENGSWRPGNQTVTVPIK
jgi:RHS repeat-associated protein